MKRDNNALGVLILIAVMALTPLVPQVGMSAQPPQWVWDENGKVHDATGQYRPMTEEETNALFGITPVVKPVRAPLTMVADADSGGGR